MLTTSERALVQTIRAYAGDQDLRAWNDNCRDLHINVDFGAGPRHLKFDDTSKHDLADLTDEQRTDVVALLFANAATWLEGTADVRCLRDVLVTPSMINNTDFQVFVGDFPVSQGLRLSTAMKVKS